MDRLLVNTSHGPLALVGRLHAGGPRPTLLVIPGAFPTRNFRHELVDDYPGANVLVGSLPGMDAPWLKASRPDAYAAAFDEAVARLVPHDPLVVYSGSTGCLVSLGMRAPNLIRHVVDEPFDSTAALWPLEETFRRYLKIYADKPEVAQFIWNFFGLSEDAWEDRSYRPLFQAIDRPTDVLVGREPLEPRRDYDGWPSLASQPLRALLAGNPLVTLHHGPPGSGHGYSATPAGRRQVGRILLAALHQAARGL